MAAKTLLSGNGQYQRMDFAKWVNQAKDLGFSALSQASDAVGAGVGFVKSAIGPAWLFGSTETSSSYDDDRVDEKHYFLIPDRRSDAGYSLYVMRCIPEGVPPINDLPKRRLFHLPNEHALPTVEHILLADARGSVEDAPLSPCSVGSRLNHIADEIDRLDGKVFGGVLLIGGLVAVINPLAGAAVALKALLPSLGLLFTKYGLKYAGDAANARDMASRIKAAEKDVLRQFRASGTDTLVNPLLTQLDRALETSVWEYEPILDFEPETMAFGQRDRDRFFKLTCQAIANTYDDVLDDPAGWDRAKLGPEDIRYLKLLRSFTDNRTK
ncbi:MAG: hypothetical protein ACYC4U_20690 [Pirellulaceae bacterium]